MPNSALPPWFPFQDKSNTKLVFEERVWKQLLIDRINLVGVNGKKEFKRDRDESYEEYLNRGKNEIQSHIVLRFGVCLDPRLSAWFIESEGDLFEFRFRRATWKEKVVILNYIFPRENLEPVWMLIEDLDEMLSEDVREILNIHEAGMHTKRTKTGVVYQIKDQTGMKKIIALDFRYANMLVKHKRAKLYKGWVVDTLDRLMSTIKKRYEKILGKELVKFANRIENSTGSNIKRLAKEMNELLHGLIKPKRDFRVDNILLKGNFDDHLKYYPPCIQDLILAVEKSGYIPHWERFQLGLFLKHTGMDVNDQLQYWFSKAVDNINLSFDEFVKKAGYIIRHIYGLEGAKIDYDMPACNTIQNKMYCTFRHSDMNNINHKLGIDLDHQDLSEVEDNTETSKLKQEIISLVSEGFAGPACARYLQLNFKKKLNSIKHPMIYLRLATENADVIIDQPDWNEKKKSNITEDKPNTEEQIPHN